MTLKKIHKLARHLSRLLSAPAQRRLFQRKSFQQKYFTALAAQAGKILHNLVENIDAALPIEPWTTAPWRTANQQLYQSLLPTIPFDFLRLSQIRGMMVVNYSSWWLGEELAYLRRQLPRTELLRLLEEDYIGKPIICNRSYLASANGIHHLYHLMRFQNETDCKINETGVIIEWGGGYGNLAKIVRRMNPSATYVIIDTPIFCAIQWIYLSSLLGQDAVCLIDKPHSTIKPHAINIVPVNLVPELKLECELFIATWSLSESSKYAIDYVSDQRFFGAKHFLTAYQKNSRDYPDAPDLCAACQLQGGREASIPFLPHSAYVFR